MANSEDNIDDDNKIKELLMAEDLSSEESNKIVSDNNKSESDEISSIKNDLDLINNIDSQNEENNIPYKSRLTIVKKLQK